MDEDMSSSVLHFKEILLLSSLLMLRLSFSRLSENTQWVYCQGITTGHLSCFDMRNERVL